MSRNRIAAFAIGVIAVVALGGLVAMNQTARSDPPAKEKENRPEDRAAIRQMMKQFIQAFEEGDADAAANYLTAEAEIIPDEGDMIQGRNLIKTTYSAFFKENGKRKVTLEPERMHFTSRNTAIEEGHMKVVPEKGESETHRYHILYVRENGKWLISVIKEWPSETAALRELDWLIGTWRAKRGEAEVDTTYQWFGNKSFIKSNITIKGKERNITAMQMIGIDPKSGELRIWTFEYDGGFGEGTITRDGKKWVFSSATAMSDGSVLTATNILTRVNHDAFTWQPVNLAIDGESVADEAPVKVTRVKTTKRIE